MEKTVCVGLQRPPRTPEINIVWGPSKANTVHRPIPAYGDPLVILSDSADFAVDDVDALVTAAFAWPYCRARPPAAAFNRIGAHWVG
jgi:hypothetical protein